MRTRALAACCLLALTWGFSLHVYDRWQRVSGFESEEKCNGIRAKIAALHQEPGDRVLCCEPDS